MSGEGVYVKTCVEVRVSNVGAVAGCVAVVAIAVVAGLYLGGVL